MTGIPLFRLLVIGLFVLAGLAAPLVGVPARAGAQMVLSFDDLGAPAGGRVTLDREYESLGVTFNNVSAIDYSQRPGDAPSA